MGMTKYISLLPVTNYRVLPALVVPDIYLSTWEEEAGISLEFEASLIYNKFQSSQGYIMGPCL